MAFNFYCDANFTVPKVREYLSKPKVTTFSSSPPGSDDPELLRVPGAIKMLGQFRDINGNPLTTLVGEVASRYDVFKDRSLVSSTIKAVPIRYKVTVELYAQLFVKKGSDSIIEDLTSTLQKFDPDTESAEDVAEELATRTVKPISRDQYLVSVFYVITKDEGEIEKALPLDWASARAKDCGSVEQKSGSTISGKDLCQSLAEGEYWTDIKVLTDVPPPVPVTDPIRETEAADPKDGATIEAVRDKIEILNAPADCAMLIRGEPIEIAAILSYPEFMIEWKVLSFKIGCVRINLEYPVLMYRMATMVLYASLFHAPHEFDEYTEKVVVEVLRASAMVAAVTFYATGNFVSAYAMFKGAMLIGLIKIFGTMIKCLLPEIFLIKKEGGWEPVIKAVDLKI